MTVRIEYIMLEISKGATVDTAMHAACVAALEHRCEVRFVFNDRLFSVRYDNIMSCVQKVKDSLPE